MKRKNPRGARRGISLIEGVLYLVIALAVIIGGIIFFQQAQLSNRVNDTARMVTSLHVQTRALFKDQKSFGEIPLEAYLIKSDIVPEQFISGGTYGDRLGPGSVGSGGDDDDGDLPDGGGDGGVDLCDSFPDAPMCGNDEDTVVWNDTGSFCDINPLAAACQNGAPSDSECATDPMNPACWVGGTTAGGEQIFGPRGDTEICTVSGAPSIPACDMQPDASLDYLCGTMQAPADLCKHLDASSAGPLDMSFGSHDTASGGFLWNAQSGPIGGGADPFDIGLVIEHSWDGQVSVYGATNYFDITLWDLPRAACARLAQVNGTGEGPLGTGIAEISFDNYTETYPDFPLDATEAEQYCGSEQNNMVRIAYRKDPGSSEPIDTGSVGGGSGGPGGDPEEVPWVDEDNDGLHDDCEVNHDGMVTWCPPSEPPAPE